MNPSHAVIVPLLILLAACNSEGEGVEEEGSADGASEPQDGCVRGDIEADLLVIPVVPIEGDGGALATVPPEGYVVSTTYLRQQRGDAGAARFAELSTPIIGILSTQPGLVGAELALSESCGTARTLSVWASTEAMYDFVLGAVHKRAIDHVSEVSRGGSMTTHWTANSADLITWEEAARQLKVKDGPYY